MELLLSEPQRYTGFVMPKPSKLKLAPLPHGGNSRHCRGLTVDNFVDTRNVDVRLRSASQSLSNAQFGTFPSRLHPRRAVRTGDIASCARTSFTYSKCIMTSLRISLPEGS
jgi:hypothetical protein